MIQNGLKPSKPDVRDYDFQKTFGAIGIPQFPDQYLTDAGFGFPDQNAEGEPFGCTNYSQSSIANDIEIAQKHTPVELEAVTHANANGGAQIRDSLQAARKLGWIASFFNVQAYAPLDWFDAFRYAIMAGFPEHRSISWGTPWLAEFQNIGLGNGKTGKDGIVQMPTNFSLTNVPWHNSKFSGWKTIKEIPYLINKSWQGTHIGDGGYLYFSREVVNRIMQISGTVAFTATQSKPTNIQTVDLPILDWIISHLKILLGWKY